MNGYLAAMEAESSVAVPEEPAIHTVDHFEGSSRLMKEVSVSQPHPFEF
jgi:hypothetical protein